MFERKFKSLILQILGRFVEDFDDSEIVVDSWSGHVKQYKLNLKPSSLNFLSQILGLDILIVRGTIGALQLHFSWRALWSEPIRLNLENLYVVCRPQQVPDPSLFVSRRRKKKRSRLDDLIVKNKFESERMSYLQQIEATIADNLCISLKNVHIRYEDALSNPYRPFIIGLTLEKLVYSPCDRTWSKGFVSLETKRKTQLSYLVLELGEFAVYHITKCSDIYSMRPDWLSSLSIDRFSELMFPYIGHKGYSPHISEYYLLRPVNAEIRVRRSLNSQAEIPKTSISIIVEEIACAIETNQYQDLLMLGNIMSINLNVGEFVELRPTGGVTGNAKAWWSYLLSVIKARTHKGTPLSPEMLEKRAELKKRYVEAYQHYLIKDYEASTKKTFMNFTKNPQFSAMTASELDAVLLEIEDEMTVEMLLLFRTVAERQLSGMKDIEKNRKKGWIEWGVGWFSSDSTKEEQQFLDSLVEYSRFLDDDDSAVKTFINFELKKCSISLSARQIGSSLTEFLKIALDQVTIQRQVANNSNSVFMLLNDFSVTDLFTPITKFKHLVKGKPKSFERPYEIEEEIFPVENDGFPKFGDFRTFVEPIFHFTLDADSLKNYRLQANMQPLEVLFNNFCVQRIQNFFKIPEALALYELIEIQALNQFANFKLRTQARMDYILKNHMNLWVNMSIQAPLIICPQDPQTEDTPQIMIDLGHLSITSKENEHIHEEDQYYDHFQVVMSDLNAILMHGEAPLNLVNKFDILMDISKSRIPKDPGLAIFKVKGMINHVTVNLSILHYHLLSQYIPQNPEVVDLEQPIYYMPPSVLIEEDDEDEFFDAEEPEDTSKEFHFSFNKEHLVAEFAVNNLDLLIYKDLSASEDPILSLQALELLMGGKYLEASRLLRIKIGTLKAKEYTRDALLVDSVGDSEDLIDCEILQICPNHPDFYKNESSVFIRASLSYLHLLYLKGPLDFLLYSERSSEKSVGINSRTSIEVNLKQFEIKLDGVLKEKLALEISTGAIKVDPKKAIFYLGQVSLKDIDSGHVILETMGQELAGVQVDLENQELELQVEAFKLAVSSQIIQQLAALDMGSNKQSSNALKAINVKMNRPSVHIGDVMLGLSAEAGLIEVNNSQENFQVSTQVLKLYTYFEETKEVLIKNCSFSAEKQGIEHTVNVSKFKVDTNARQVHQVLTIAKDHSYLFQKERPPENLEEEKKEEEAEDDNEEDQGIHLKCTINMFEVDWNLETAVDSPERSKIILHLEDVFLKKTAEISATVSNIHSFLETDQREVILIKQYNAYQPIFQFEDNYLAVNGGRIILSPKRIESLNHLYKELQSFSIYTPNSNRNGNENADSPSYYSSLLGHISKLELCLREDSDLSESSFYSSYYVLQISARKDSESAKLEGICIVKDRADTIESGSELNRKYILYPADFVFSEQSLQTGRIDIELDLSILKLLSKLSSLSKSEPSSSEETVSLNYSFTIEHMNILIDTNSDLVILVELSNLSAMINSPAISVGFSLSVLYFNDILNNWEPLLEKSSLQIDYESEQRKKILKVEGLDLMNLNITHPLLRNLYKFSKVLDKFEELEPQKASSCYWINNETGQNVKCWNQVSQIYLQSMEKQPLDFEEHISGSESPVVDLKLKLKKNNHREKRVFNLQIVDLTVLYDLEFEKLGPKVFTVTQGGNFYQILVDSQYKQGLNVVSVQSLIRLQNLLRVPIDIRVIDSHRSEYKSAVSSVVISIQPNETVPLPILFTHAEALQVLIEGYSWSTRYSLKNSNFQIIDCPILVSPVIGKTSHTAFAILRSECIEVPTDNENLEILLLKFLQPVTIENYLSCDLEFQCSDQSEGMFCSGKLDQGETFHWMEATVLNKLYLSLRLPGYEWTSSEAIEFETKTLFQFSAFNRDQVNIIVETVVDQGVLSIVAYSKYWLENKTSLPIYFMYQEDSFEYDVISLPFTVNGQVVEDKKKTAMVESSVFAFGDVVQYQASEFKPWEHYKHQSSTGLSSLVSDLEPEEINSIKMFTNYTDNERTGTGAIRIANSLWSDPFHLINPQPSMPAPRQSIQALEVTEYKNINCLYEISMTMHSAPHPFNRTKVIKFAPRFVFISKLTKILIVGQFEPSADMDSVCVLFPDEKTHFHWPDSKKQNWVSIKPDGFGWEWSGRFSIEKPNDFVLRVRNSFSHEEILVHITVTLEDSTLNAIFQDVSHRPPFRIENLTGESIKIMQKEVPEMAKIVGQFEIASYAWDEPLKKKLLRIELISQCKQSTFKVGDFKLGKAHPTKQLKIRGDFYLYIEILSEGPTKVVSIRQQEDNPNQIHQPQYDSFAFAAQFNSIGISVVDSRPQEIVYASLSDLRVSVSMFQSDISAKLMVSSAQVDNQLYSAINPVVLSMRNKEQPFLLLTIDKRRSNVLIQDVNYFQNVQVSLAPIDIKIDGFFLQGLSEYFATISDIQQLLASREDSGPQRCYFDRLVIQKASVRATFYSIPSMYDDTDHNPLKMFYIIFSNIGNVNLEFKEFKIAHRHLTTDLLGKELALFYNSQCKNQLIYILGSSDALGNPSELFRHIKRGVKDLLTLNGQSNPIGLYRGLCSFARETFVGTSGSASKFFDSLKKGLHSVYLSDRAEMKNGWKIGLAVARASLTVPTIFVSMASSTANSLRDAVQSQYAVCRKRPPRSFLMSSLVKEYSYIEAVGQELLMKVDSGRYFREGIVMHASIEDRIILLTSKRVLYADISLFSLLWNITLQSITLVKINDAELSIFYIDELSEDYSQRVASLVGNHEILQTLYNHLIENH